MSGDTLRIALLTHSVNPRGGVVHALELARALHEAGRDVTVFAPAAPGDEMFRDVPCRVVLRASMAVRAASRKWCARESPRSSTPCWSTTQAGSTCCMHRTASRAMRWPS
jgi:hypothetical protein